MRVAVSSRDGAAHEGVDETAQPSDYGARRPPQQNIPGPAEPVDPLEELERRIGKREPPAAPKKPTSRR
jgi:hypothetical protein